MNPKQYSNTALKSGTSQCHQTYYSLSQIICHLQMSANNNNRVVLQRNFVFSQATSNLQGTLRSFRDLSSSINFSFLFIGMECQGECCCRIETFCVSQFRTGIQGKLFTFLKTFPMLRYIFFCTHFIVSSICMFRRDLMYTYESRNGEIKRSHEKFFFSLGDAKINIFCCSYR